MRRLLAFAIPLAAVAFVLPGPALADPGGGGCQLHGSANISPGLGSAAQDFAYSFTGDLTNCQSSTGGPSSGTVFAGTNGLAPATGNGSCGSSTTSGVAVIRWADNTTTVVQYTTSGALAAVSLQGDVIGSVTTSDGLTTYTTNRYAGNGALGTLVFQPPDPTACTGAGVTPAGIDGTVGLGASS